jgi:hypothetical protein
MKATGHAAISEAAWFGLTKRAATSKSESAKETETPAAESATA